MPGRVLGANTFAHCSENKDDASQDTRKMLTTISTLCSRGPSKLRHTHETGGPQPPPTPELKKKSSEPDERIRPAQQPRRKTKGLNGFAEARSFP